MLFFLAWTASLAFTSLIYYSVGTLRGVHLSIVLLYRYILPLQKDENIKRHYVHVAWRYSFASTWLKQYAHNENLW
jgi:hypothetical protein